MLLWHLHSLAWNTLAASPPWSQSCIRARWEHPSTDLLLLDLPEENLLFFCNHSSLKPDKGCQHFPMQAGLISVGIPVPKQGVGRFLSPSPWINCQPLSLCKISPWAVPRDHGQLIYPMKMPWWHGRVGSQGPPPPSLPHWPWAMVTSSL